jgi:archaellin
VPKRRRAAIVLTAAAAPAVLLAAAALTAVDAQAASTGCGVSYAVSTQWAGGFTANVVVTNLGSPLNGWQLTWSFGAGQTVTQAWNATVSQSGAAVTAADAGYNAPIATNGTASFGFNGAWNNTSNPVPASFALNGVTCTGTASGSPSPTRSATPSPTRSAGPTPTSSPRPSSPPPSSPPPSSSPPSGPVLAFPGAVGFGSVATGGRGGTVYHVTNLNDSGAGSFRDAVSGSNRIVVFDVGGYINLSSPVSARSNLTIAGQTAPGGGIGIMGREVSFDAASNDIVRDIRFRQGDLDPDSGKSGINLLDTTTMIFDHVSIEFAQWNNIDSVGAVNITVQNSIDADPIGQQFAAHTETGPYTWYNNVFANSHNRCPLAKANTQYINNVVYDYQAGYTAGNSSGHFLHDVIGNYFITGPRTTSASNAYYQMGNQSVFNSGNVLDSNNDGALNGSSLGLGGGATALTSPWSPTTAGIAARTAAAAYTYDLANSGALPHDQVDTLVLADVSSLGRLGDLWSHQTSTGLSNSGYGTIAGGTAPVDTDRDGMPDAWETRYGLNPGSASDATGDFDHTGYTNVEKYIDSRIDGRYP